MTSSKFLQGLSPDGLQGFARLMTSFADDLGAQVYEIAERSGEAVDIVTPDMTFLSAEARLDINASAVNAFGYDFQNHFGTIYDDLFKDLDLPVVDFDDPRAETVGIAAGVETVNGTEILDELLPSPDVTLYDEEALAAARERYGDIFHLKKANPSGLPRLMIMGHARHGKDTVCSIMEELYGLRWVSSSWKCAEMVICRILSDEHFAKEFLDTLQESMRAKFIDQIKDYNQRWAVEVNKTRLTKEPPKFVDWAFSVRADYRELWYQAIRWYNWGDPTKLCREIMEVADCYCGIRDARELTAIWNSDLLDDVIWVDASQRLQPEDPKSISVRPEMATLHLDNNHDVERLCIAVMQLMWGQYGLLPKT